jgi:hypothetical protein
MNNYGTLPSGPTSTTDYGFSSGGGGFSGGGGGFNWDSLISGIAQLGVAGFQFGSNYVNAQNGGGNMPNYALPGTGLTYTPGAQPQQPAQQSNNTLLYIVLIVLALVLVLGGIYFFTRK